MPALRGRELGAALARARAVWRDAKGDTDRKTLLAAARG